MKKQNINRIAVFFMFTLLAIVVSSALSLGLNQMVSLQGKVTDSNGNLINNGNVTITIFDSQTGGALIYNSTTNFNGEISSGFFDVMLGSITGLNLNLSENYYMDLMINGEDIDWSGSERRSFQSPVGYKVSGSDNFSVDTAVLFIDTENNKVGVGTNEPLSPLSVIGNISSTGNFSLGEKITFSLGSIFHNFAQGWMKLSGSLNITNDLTVIGNINVSKSISAVNVSFSNAIKTVTGNTIIRKYSNDIIISD